MSCRHDRSTPPRRLVLPILPALVLALCAGAPQPVYGTEFPVITEYERSLEVAPGYPEAPAIVLFRKGHFLMMGSISSQNYSSLRVEGRLKILSEDGVDHGEVAIPHSDFIRLVSFEGRTVTPDGREVPLPDDALFQESVTGDKSWYRTKAVFPAVEPGAILDYRYELRFEVVTDLSPWYFQTDIPTLHSKIVYSIPESVSAQPWGQATFGRRFESSQRRTGQGTELQVWMDDLPPVPDEVASLPFEDLSSRFLVVPTALHRGGSRRLLFEDWESACDVAHFIYREVRRRDGRTRARGKELAKAAGREPGEKARALYAFVRDEIALVDLPGVTPVVGESLDEMVREQRADHAGKGLILEAMLDAAGLDPELVWAADRRFGRVDLEVANPAWFEAVLVRIELDGEEIFLDPSRPGHGFGYLHPGLEGMQAIVYSRKDSRTIRLPVRPYSANTRRVTLDLTVEEEGRVTGTGELEEHGHHGALWYRAHASSTARAEAVREYLEESFPGYEIGEPTLVEDLEGARLEATWTLRQLDEEVLGTQAELVPSRPLGPLDQPFHLGPVQRITPVQLGYADSDRMEVRVTWPAGWIADVLPDEVAVDNRAGAFTVTVDLAEEERTVRYSRRLDTTQAYFERSEYGDLRALYAAVDESDEQELVVLRE